MINKDRALLEEAYNLIQARQILMSEGYTKEEVDALVSEGKVWDAVRNVGKKVGKYAAIGATAAGMMGGSMARGNEVDDAVNRTKSELATSVRDFSSKYAKSQEDIAKQGKIDRAKMDTIDKRIRGELFPLLTKGYEAAGPYLGRLIGDITATGLTSGRADYDKQLEAIDKVKKVLQSTSGMDQKTEVEKMLKSQYYKW